MTDVAPQRVAVIGVETTRPRDIRLDALKGTAILLVVLGHALVRATPASPVAGPGLVSVAGVGWVEMRTLLNPLFNAIYTFHMPLFAFVSGYVMLGSSAGHGRAQVWRRFLSLMVPYVAWVVVAWAVIGNKSLAGFAAFFGSALVNPLSPGGLWFLYALFASVVIFAVVKSMSGADTALVIAAIIVGLSGVVPAGRYEHLLGLSEIAWLFPFFVAGYLAAEHRKVLDDFRWGLPVALLGWVASAALIWPVMIPGDRWWYAGAISWAASVGAPGAVVVAKGVWALARVVCALSGVAVLYYAYARISGGFAAVQSWLGRRSMGMYAAHGWFLLPFGVAGGGLRVLVVFASALLGGILVTLVLEQVGVTRKVLLGHAR